MIKSIFQAQMQGLLEGKYIEADQQVQDLANFGPRLYEYARNYYEAKVFETMTPECGGFKCMDNIDITQFFLEDEQAVSFLREIMRLVIEQEEDDIKQRLAREYKEEQ